MLVETFQTFLKDSDRKHISPERNWNSADMPRKMWKEIFDYLEAEGKIVPDSAAGSHSWEWVGNWYERYCAAYWTIGRTFVDMNLDMEQENRSTS